MRKLLLVALVLLAGCASVVEPPANPNRPEPSQPVDASACLWVMVKGPKTVVEGKGLEAQLEVRNFCVADIRIPVANATALSGGKDTKVELSFQLMVANSRTADSQGGNVRWMSTDEDPNATYEKTQRWVTLPGGQSLLRTLSWDGRDSAGKVLRQGTYDLVGLYYFTPKGLDSMESVPFFVWQPFKIVSD